MMAYIPKDAEVALDIIEKSPSLALRVSGGKGMWKTEYISAGISSYGYTREDFTTGNTSWTKLVHPDDLQKLYDIMDTNFAKGTHSYITHYRVVCKNGSVLWVEASHHVSCGSGGQLLYLDCIILNYDETMQNQAQIQDNLRQQKMMNDILQSLYSGNLNEAVPAILQRTGEYLGISRVLLFKDDDSHSTSQAVYEWTEADIAPLMGENSFSLDYAKDIQDTREALQKNGMHIINFGQVPPGLNAIFVREGIVASAVFAVYHKARPYGFICFDECKKQRHWDENTLVFLQNIAKLVSTAIVRRRNEEIIRNLAYVDQLTGLANRYRFDDCLQQAIEQAGWAGQYGFVMLIDMDDFKIINEGYGHDYGDELLICVADFLKQQFGEMAQLFRFGGDEFAVLVGHKNAEKTQMIIDDVIARARMPWKVRQREFYCTTSIGVVRFPDDNDGHMEVSVHADIAMYEAKNLGKNRYAFYNKKLQNHAQHRAETEHRMRDAIENNFEGFHVYYQPVVNLKGKIVSAEALVRWEDENKNLLLPGEFIPLAEYLGLISPLGEYVLRKAAEECQRINQLLPRFSISVNVSIRQFQQRDFLARVETILNKAQVNKGNIVLEITEGMLVQDLEHMKRQIEKLRGMGVRIAMDDFGTGYSSLNNMRRLPLDIIKIDRSFIRDVATDDYAKTFVRLITDLSHSMKRLVCVEGVETQEQRNYCQECNADVIQGFFYHGPMPALQLNQVLHP